MAARFEFRVGDPGQLPSVASSDIQSVNSKTPYHAWLREHSGQIVERVGAHLQPEHTAFAMGVEGCPLVLPTASRAGRTACVAALSASTDTTPVRGGAGAQSFDPRCRIGQIHQYAVTQHRVERSTAGHRRPVLTAPMYQ
ncbi:hypothetical protein ABZU76_38330 [Amycolatopsis sp. NPDC005232]|uniref:hypothetical protein n=1 Tax=Amycolatopsis sp. NPDC005232 TaxID=3157027 RepID=UPI0033B2E1CD